LRSRSTRPIAHLGRFRAGVRVEVRVGVRARGRVRARVRVRAVVEQHYAHRACTWRT